MTSKSFLNGSALFTGSGGLFFGRKKELALLDKLITSHTSRFAPIVITGMGGIGKTTLVREYIQRRFPRGQTIWIDAEQSSSEDPDEGIFNLFKKELNKRKMPSIVVLDGADWQSGKELVNTSQRFFNYKAIRHVIVTTRVINRIKGAKYLTLLGLPVSDAVALLNNHLNEEIPAEDIVKLATLLNGVPAALNLISNFLKDHPVDEVWSFIEGYVYDLGYTSTTTKRDLIKVVQPKIVLVTDSLIMKLQKSPQDIYKVTPRQFEQMVADLLADMGCDVELTKETRDGGKDILAYMNTELGRILCLVEAKRHSRTRPVGVGIIRNLYGTFCDYQANSAMLVTTSHFSEDAREFQRRHEYHLSLRDYTDVVDWINKYKTG